MSATLNATESASDIGVLTPYLWIAQGATVSVPLTAVALSNGGPQNKATVNFTVASGSGTLSSASAQTNSSGDAAVTLSLAQFTSEVQVNACIAPANAPCQQIYATPVPLSQLNLEPVSGAGQISDSPTFQPLVVRVVDSASPPHPVLAAPVVFLTTVLRPGGAPPGAGGGETNPINPAMPVILSVSQSSATSDINGLASITPSSNGFSPPLEVDMGVTAGAASLNDPLQLLPAPTSGSEAAGVDRVGRSPTQLRGLIEAGGGTTREP